MTVEDRQRDPIAPASTQYRYWAFISYSSRDASWAKWLHRAIETYKIPSPLVGHPTPAGWPAPKRFHPLFRDRDELPASHDLGTQIEEALRASRYLIVICSPNAARSQWVNKEIEYFGGLGRSERILAVIVDGEPHTGGELECFPAALRSVEPLAADARPDKDDKPNAKLKVLAGMLGVSLDALKQRDAQRRARRLQAALAVALSLVAAFAALAWYSNHQRLQAIAARQQAEQQRQLADLNALRAEEQRRLALDTLNDLVITVQRELSADFGSLKLRQKLLDVATAGLKKVGEAANEDGPGADRGMAAALLQVGDILHLAGRTAGAAEAYGNAAGRFESLAKSGRNADLARRDLSIALTRLGRVQLQQGQSVAAEKSFMRAIELTPPNAAGAADRWALLLALGDVKLEVDDAPAACGLYEQALRTAGLPDRERAIALKRLASAQLRAAQRDKAGDLLGQAGANLRQAIALDRQASTADGAGSRQRHDLSVGLALLAELELRAGHLAEAQQAIVEALGLIEEMAREHTDRVDLQRDWAGACFLAGEIAQARGQPTDAAASYGRAMQILRGLNEVGKLDGSVRGQQLLKTVEQRLETANRVNRGAVFGN